jgi:hypothetical protein
VIATDGNGGFTVTATSNTYSYSTDGIYTPTITITDTSDSRTVISTATINVTSESVSVSNFTGTLGVAYTNTIATFTDSHTGLSPSMYQATIDWGDGNESQGVIITDPSISGQFDVLSSNVFATAGTLTLTVTITDPSGATIAATGTATVKGIVTTTQPITQSPGAPFSGVIGTFTNTTDSTGSDSYTGLVSWGGGVWSTATLQPISSGSNVFDIISTNPSNAQGTYNPGVTIFDNTKNMDDQDIIPPDPNAVSPPTTPTYTFSPDCTAVTLTWVNTATNSTNVVIEEENETPNAYHFPTDENLHVVDRLDAYVTSQVIAVTPGGEYLFDVGAVGIGEAGYSGVIDVTPPMPAAPEAPSDVTASVSGSPATVSVNWTSVSGVSYLVQYQETSNTLNGNSKWQDWYGGYSDYGDLDAGQSYSFRVIASESVDGVTVSSTSGITALTYSGPTVAQPPADTFTSQGWSTDNGGVDVTLGDSPPADDGTFVGHRITVVQNGVALGNAEFDYSNEFDYDYDTDQYSVSPGDWDYYHPWQPCTVEYNTIESYQVTVGTSTVTVYSMSRAVTADVPPVPGATAPTGSAEHSAPAAPTNLTAAYSSNGDAIDLEWDDNSNNEANFNIYESLDDGTTWITAPVAITGADGASVPVPLAGGGGGGGAFQTGGRGGNLGRNLSPPPLFRGNAGNLYGPSGYSNNASPNTTTNFYIYLLQGSPGVPVPGVGFLPLPGVGDLHESVGLGVNYNVADAYGFGWDLGFRIFPPESTWFGFPIADDESDFTFEGNVDSMPGDVLGYSDIVAAKHVTAAEYISWGKMMNLLKNTKERYTPQLYSCRLFAQLEFQSAPGTLAFENRELAVNGL